MTEYKYLSLLEAITEGLKHGNDTLIPFDFIRKQVIKKLGKTNNI